MPSITPPIKPINYSSWREIILGDLERELYAKEHPGTVRYFQKIATPKKR